MPDTPSMSLTTKTCISAPYPPVECGLEPRGGFAERVGVRRLEHDLDFRAGVEERGVAPDHHGRMPPGCLLEDGDDLAFAGRIPAPPGPDGRAAESVGDRLEHRHHLAREPG